MPFSGALSLLGPAIGIGSGIAGLFGGSPASKVNVPTPYQYQSSSGADSNAYSGIGNLGAYNTYGQYLPQAQGIGQGLINNPYSGQYQQGAGVAGQLGQGAGLGSYGAGGALGQSAFSTLPDVSALLNMGFDPQNALYSQLQAQNSQQANAQNAASGIANTPYGAGAVDQSNNNFNLQWQNNLLNRASQGAGAAGSLLGQAGGAFQQGADMQQQGASNYLQGSQVPYQAFSGIGQNQLGTIGQIGGLGQSAAGQSNQQIGDYLAYLSGGTSAANAGSEAAKVQLGQANSSFTQNQAFGNSLGQGLTGFGKAWSTPNNWNVTGL